MARLGIAAAVAIVGAGLLWAAPALSQDLPVTPLKVIGLQSGRYDETIADCEKAVANVNW